MDNSNRNEFSIREEVTVKKDAILFSEPSLFTYDQPAFNNQNLTAELVYQGLDFPNSMAVLNSNDTLILEKNNGTVQRIVNGSILENPIIDLNVSGFAEEGLVGIAIANATSNDKITYVFLYFTASTSNDTADNTKSEVNRLVRYELFNNELVNPKVILELPSSYRGIHNWGGNP